jgi:hypothetical protein
MSADAAVGSSESLARALRSMCFEVAESLPVAPVESSPITFYSAITCVLGVVDEHPSIPASRLTLQCMAKRLTAGRALHFVISPPPGSFDVADAQQLSSRADVTRLDAFLQQSADTSAASAAPPAPTALAVFPATYEPSSVHGGVLVKLLIPPAAPEGSRVMISRVSVAGCDVALGETPPQVLIGFNHAAAEAGPLCAAASSSDLPALIRALEDGASTEERDAVSGRTQA